MKKVYEKYKVKENIRELGLQGTKKERRFNEDLKKAIKETQEQTVKGTLDMIEKFEELIEVNIRLYGREREIENVGNEERTKALHSVVVELEFLKRAIKKKYLGKKVK